METPPPILDFGKVVAFANADDSVVRVRNDLIFVGGKPLDNAAKFAICKYPIESEFYLCFCDDSWNVLGGIPYPSVDASNAGQKKNIRGSCPSGSRFTTTMKLQSTSNASNLSAPSVANPF